MKAQRKKILLYFSVCCNVTLCILWIISVVPVKVVPYHLFMSSCSKRRWKDFKMQQNLTLKKKKSQKLIVINWVWDNTWNCLAGGGLFVWFFNNLLAKFSNVPKWLISQFQKRFRKQSLTCVYCLFPHPFIPILRCIQLISDHYSIIQC